MGLDFSGKRESPTFIARGVRVALTGTPWCGGQWTSAMKAGQASGSAAVLSRQNGLQNP